LKAYYSGDVFMRNRPFAIASAAVLMLGIAGPAAAQDNGGQPPTARQQLERIHTPQSFDAELAHLTKDLELTPEQQRQVMPLLHQHHDKIQALLDKNPTATRQELFPQIHAISDETHRQIHALLTDRQKKLESAMMHRGRGGAENRRFAPPSAASPGPSPAGS
jgi:hypothetical protein